MSGLLLHSRADLRAMDFLLALVAPVLSKVLYFVYLSGVATSFHLQQNKRKAIRGLPPLPPQRPRSHTSFGEAKPQASQQTEVPATGISSVWLPALCTDYSTPCIHAVKALV